MIIVIQNFRNYCKEVINGHHFILKKLFFKSTNSCSWSKYLYTKYLWLLITKKKYFITNTIFGGNLNLIINMNLGIKNHNIKHANIKKNIL